MKIALWIIKNRAAGSNQQCGSLTFLVGAVGTVGTVGTVLHGTVLHGTVVTGIIAAGRV
jgi:hypothetical protein